MHPSGRRTGVPKQGITPSYLHSSLKHLVLHVIFHESTCCPQEAFAIIEEDIGAPLEKIFTQITSEPVAAASLGQVYRATLRETGEEVAIKV